MQWSKTELEQAKRKIARKAGSKSEHEHDRTSDSIDISGSYHERIKIQALITQRLIEGNYRKLVLFVNYDMNAALSAALNNRHEYGKLKKNIEQNLRSQLEGIEKITGKNIYCFDWFIPDLRKDPDNIAAARKVILDAMQTLKHRKTGQILFEGILDNDGHAQIHSFGGDLFFVDKLNPRVEIYIVKAS